MALIALDSLPYYLFLFLVFAFYWSLKRPAQNLFLLAASYLFYASWNWKCLSLILISTLIDFYCGRRIFLSNEKRERKSYLVLSIVSNLTILSIFKYAQFFVDSFSALLNQAGIQTYPLVLNIILPVGISFYTFQTLSYTLDIYYGRLRPARSFVDFALYVSFFTQLVAGPIERAKHLLPQLTSERRLKRRGFFVGLDLIFWGLVKKIFIADNIGAYVNFIYDLKNPTLPLLFLGALGFGIQIFCDFSAYTDIARGSARLLGFNLVKNFFSPYKAVNIGEFWKRWHQSLSYWIRDYVYFPLGGSRCGRGRTVFNIALTWFLCGLWHGASWNFVLWGLAHGAFILFFKFYRARFSQTFPLPRFLSIALTYLAVNLTWTLFRVEDLQMLSMRIKNTPDFFSFADFNVALILASLFLFYCLPFIIKRLWIRLRSGLILSGAQIQQVRFFSYAFFLILIFVFQRTESHDFIYFQF